jgi:hypothetical protein
MVEVDGLMSITPSVSGSSVRGKESSGTFSKARIQRVAKTSVIILHVIAKATPIDVSTNCSSSGRTTLIWLGQQISCARSENVEQWELSLVGIYTVAPFADAQREFLRINQAIRDLGCPLKAPVLALSFVALQTIPTYGLSDKGLFDARVQGFVSPVLSAE